MPLKFPKPKKRSKRKTYWKKGLDGKMHEFLYGREAHLLRRMEIYRQAYGLVELRDGEIVDLAAATCQLCDTGHGVEWNTGHWIHLEKRHCDCLSCGTFGCKAAHTRLHHGSREFL